MKEPHELVSTIPTISHRPTQVLNWEKPTTASPTTTGASNLTGVLHEYITEDELAKNTMAELPNLISQLQTLATKFKKQDLREMQHQEETLEMG